MTALSSAFAMGGYAGYVWSAYGLVSVVLIINVLAIKWQRKKARHKLKQWLRESC